LTRDGHGIDGDVGMGKRPRNPEEAKDIVSHLRDVLDLEDLAETDDVEELGKDDDGEAEPKGHRGQREGDER